MSVQYKIGMRDGFSVAAVVIIKGGLTLFQLSNLSRPVNCHAIILTTEQNDAYTLFNQKG